MKIFAVFAGTLVASSIALAKPAVAPTYEATGSSSIKFTPEVDPQTGDVVGQWVEKKETRFFELDYPTWNLLKTVVTTKRYSNGEGMQSEVVLEVRQSNSGRYDKVLWSAVEKGSEITFPDTGLIGVREYGCCGAEDTVRIYNEVTGKKVEATYGKVWSVNVPNSSLGNRYVAFVIDSKAPATVASGKKYLATLSYFSKEKILSRVRIYADIPAGWAAGFETLEFLDQGAAKKATTYGDVATLWGTQGKTDSATAFVDFGFASKTQYDNSTEDFKVSIGGDDFSSFGSSAGLEIVRVP